MAHIIDGICLEETTSCECERQGIPFKFKYFFSKDPCEKCLVRAACKRTCEIRYDYWDQKHSIIEWKKKIKSRVYATVLIISWSITAGWFVFILNNWINK